jgi:(1->4)-alpha-D-glucan 1-alpha-D-glucosylmutase
MPNRGPHRRPIRHRPPLGEAAWGDTVLKLRGWADGSRFENILTGETLVLRHGGLPMAEVFASFPGAVLRPVPEA